MPRLKPQEIEQSFVAAQVSSTEPKRSRGRPRKIEPMEMQIGQPIERKIKVKDGRPELESSVVEVVDRPVDPEKLAMLQFMEDELTIYIHTTTDQMAAQIVDLYNGSNKCFLYRGKEATIKRYFVEQLARAKETTYTQNKVRMDDGTEQYVSVGHTALRYPFSVKHDPHPRGADWLKHVLAEA
jgi:hypothetical protein